MEVVERTEEEKKRKGEKKRDILERGYHIFSLSVTNEKRIPEVLVLARCWCWMLDALVSGLELLFFLSSPYSILLHPPSP